MSLRTTELCPFKKKKKKDKWVNRCSCVFESSAGNLVYSLRRLLWVCVCFAEGTKQTLLAVRCPKLCAAKDVEKYQCPFSWVRSETLEKREKLSHSLFFPLLDHISKSKNLHFIYLMKTFIKMFRVLPSGPLKCNSKDVLNSCLISDKEMRTQLSG